MTKQETIQVLQSIEDRAVDFPNMTECDWVAIASAKRHLKEEPISEEFKEAACKQLAENARKHKAEPLPHRHGLCRSSSDYPPYSASYQRP